MNLLDIWESKSSWTTLSQLKKPPKLSLKLLRYEKKVIDEVDICEKARVNFVRQITGAGPNERANIEHGTPQHTEFLEKFSSFLNESESELESFDMTLDAVIDQLDPSNKISEHDLGVLEPFFKQEDK